MSEQDLLDELQALSGRSWADALAQWVHGTGELPLRPLLESAIAAGRASGECWPGAWTDVGTPERWAALNAPPSAR